MIRLNNTTKVLQSVLDATITGSQPQAYVSWFDENPNSENNVTRGADQETNLSSVVDVNICNSLGTGKENFVRNIDTINIYNKDSATAVVTVKIDDGGTETILIRKSLTTLQTLHYADKTGWQVI